MNEIFFVNVGEGTDIFYNVNEEGEVTAKHVRREYGAVSLSKPTMILDEQATRELIAAFSEKAREQGLNGPSAAEGKLQATERHLEDMRKLVFFNIEKENI